LVSLTSEREKEREREKWRGRECEYAGPNIRNAHICLLHITQQKNERLF